jgi:hypothetical protein
MSPESNNPGHRSTLRHVHNYVGRQLLEVESDNERKTNDQHRT